MNQDVEARSEVIWRAKWFIAAATLVVAAGVYVLTLQQATSYSARASVRVTVPQAKGVPQQSALASEELAAQYAQLGTTLPVLASAEKALPDGSSLAGHVSVVPLNNYNLIAVTATAATSAQAAARATAVAHSLVEYVRLINSDIVTAAGASITKQMTALDLQIAGLRKQIVKLTAAAGKTGTSADVARANLLSSQQLLSSLVSLQAASVNGSTGDIAVAQPNVAVVDEPTSGVALKPKTLLYTGAAVLAALLGFGEVAVFRSRLRTQARRRQIASQRTDPSITVARAEPSLRDSSWQEPIPRTVSLSRGAGESR